METQNPLVDFSKGIAAAAAAGGQYVVAVNGRPRVPSSGVVWGPVVVTTHHTLKRNEDITVTLPDGRNVPASLVGRDLGTDLAILKVDGVSAPKLADAASLQVGNLVLALGRRVENGLTVGMGALNALAGPYKTWRGGHVDRFLRPDINIYTGFSGGALVDVEGRVIGVNTSALTRGVGVTIPAATVNRVVEEMLSTGQVRHGYLGIGMHPVQVPGRGVGLIVMSVDEDGPAAKVGVVLGDVLLSIDGKPVSDTESVRTQAGKAVAIELLRGGQPVVVAVVPAERR